MLVDYKSNDILVHILHNYDNYYYQLLNIYCKYHNIYYIFLHLHHNKYHRVFLILKCIVQLYYK